MPQESGVTYEIGTGSLHRASSLGKGAISCPTPCTPCASVPLSTAGRCGFQYSQCSLNLWDGDSEGRIKPDDSLATDGKAQAAFEAGVAYTLSAFLGARIGKFEGKAEPYAACLAKDRNARGDVPKVFKPAVTQAARAFEKVLLHDRLERR